MTWFFSPSSISNTINYFYANKQIKATSFNTTGTVYTDDIKITGNTYFNASKFLFIDGTGNAEINFGLHPDNPSNYSIGNSTDYFYAVYASYIRYKNTPSSFDKYDDLQILRDLKTSGNKINMKNMPKEIYDKDGFTNLGGLEGFNLCASKKIVECIDDLKRTIDNLTNRLKILEKI